MEGEWYYTSRRLVYNRQSQMEISQNSTTDLSWYDVLWKVGAASIVHCFATTRGLECFWMCIFFSQRTYDWFLSGHIASYDRSPMAFSATSRASRLRTPMDWCHAIYLYIPNKTRKHRIIATRTYTYGQRVSVWIISIHHWNADSDRAICSCPCPRNVADIM